MPIFRLGAHAKKNLAEQGIVIVDGNKLQDKTTTIYKLQTKGKQPIVLQFGKGYGSRVSGSVVRWNKDGKDQQMCFLNAETDGTMREDFDNVVELIGKTLYRNKEVYWQGRCADDMTFKEFMALRSNNVKPNSLTSTMEYTLKCPEKLSKFYKVDAETNESGKISLNRRGQIKTFRSKSTPFEGVVSTIVGVYTGFNARSPTWGVFLNVRDAYINPIPRERKQQEDSIELDDVEEIIKGNEEIVVEETRAAEEVEGPPSKKAKK